MDDEKDRPSIDLDSVPVVEEEDCDEDLDLSGSSALTWLVKIPKFLSERWLQQAQAGGPGAHLGNMKIHEPNGEGNRKIEIVLPDAPDLPPIPTMYKLDVRNATSTNLYVFDELSKPEPVPSSSNPDPTASTASGSQFEKPRRVRPKVARRPRMSGTIAHECQVTPVLDKNYRAVMRARQQKAAQPKRTIQRVDQDIGTLNRMASGMTTHAQARKFAAFTRTTAKPKGEKFTRMPQTELMDALFAGFLRYKYWGMKALRDQTKQPEAYLKEVLSDIATLVKAGPYNGHWVLKPEYAELNRSNAAAQMAADDAAEEKAGPSKMEEDIDEDFGGDTDDDDDDDLDMEEIC